MSTVVEQRREIETLAWITDDEAEFWTSSSPTKRSKKFDKFSASKNSSSDDILANNLNSKSTNDSNVQMEDPLALMYKNKIEQEAQNVAENAGKKQIFEFDNTMELNENVPGVNMSFIDRLLHQLTRPRKSKVDYSSDEDFTEIDPNEITTVNNDNIKQPLEHEDNAKDETSFKDTVRSFIEELNEETDVIRGTIDHETLCNRRSHRAKSSSFSLNDNTVNQMSI